MDKIPKKENIILTGHFNGKIGNQPIPEYIGTYVEQVTSRNGAVLRDFCAYNKLKITKRLYRDTGIHKFNWEARMTESIIIIYDYK